MKKQNKSVISIIVLVFIIVIFASVFVIYWYSKVDELRAIDKGKIYFKEETWQNLYNNFNWIISTSKEATYHNQIIELEMGNNTIFQVLPACYAEYQDTSSNKKIYYGTRADCSILSFEEKTESADVTATQEYEKISNSYLKEDGIKKYKVMLKNNQEVDVIQIGDSKVIVYYPLTENTHVEIELVGYPMKKQVIKKYIIVKE